jgi:hypothetical protein
MGVVLLLCKFSCLTADVLQPLGRSSVDLGLGHPSANQSRAPASFGNSQEAHASGLSRDKFEPQSSE